MASTNSGIGIATTRVGRKVHGVVEGRGTTLCGAFVHDIDEDADFVLLPGLIVCEVCDSAAQARLAARGSDG